MDWATSGCMVNDAPTIKCLEVIFARILTFITAFAAIVFFAMLVFGGFRYLVSHGDPKQAEAARGTITAAILGIIFIVIAYLIIFIIERATGIQLTIFTIPSDPI